MPTSNPFKFLDIHTNKGAAHMLAGMAVGQGTPDESVLLTAGVFVDRETITIGLAANGNDDIYEIVDISTDSTVDVLTFWNNTDTEITQTAIDPADYTFTVGEYVAVGTEIAIVTHILVNSATDWDVSFYRGVAGTTIQAEGTGTTAIDVQEATALTAGTITVPSVAVTAAAGLDALAAIVGAAGPGLNARGPQDYNGVVNDLTQLKNPLWRLINLDDTTGLLVSTVGGVRGETVAEATTNQTLLPATTTGGTPANANINQVVTRVPTAAEVTAGAIVIPLNFEPTGVSVYVHTTADGLVVAWDGTVVLDRVLNLVTVNNGGLVDWSVAETVSVTIKGNVEVADAAVVG